MSSPKPPRNPLAKQPLTQSPQKPQPQPRFNPRGNNFSLGGRRFNGQATRRGTRH